MSIIITVVTNILCVKEFVFGVILVRIFLHFPAFGLNTERYSEYWLFWRSDRGENGMATTTKEEQFFITHEVADIRFFFFFFISIMLYQETQLLCHLNYALPENTVIMWTDITDSLLIALGCKHFFNTLKNWLEVG